MWARVSAEASTANQVPGPNSTAVRQQPEQAIEAPSATGGSARNAAGVSMTRRMSWPWAIGSMDRTLAEGGYDAGEHGLLPCVFAQHVVADDSYAIPAKARHLVKCLGSEGLHRRPAVAAHDGRRMEPGDAVHQIGAQQGGGKLAAAFDQHPGQAGCCRAP